MDGFLNLLKPPGMSSHDVVAAVRRILSCRKVGHGGTLDPAAAGVLPVAVGRCTRFIEYLAMADKEYWGEIKFGLATDSGDLTGQIVERREHFALPTQAEFEGVLNTFRGTVRQRPPLRSAIKINGRPAYKLTDTAAGAEVPEREVCIKELCMTDWRDTEKIMQIRVVCSKGTYIRSLAMDIGARLSLPAVLSFLLRSRVGNFTVQDACTLEELGELRERALLSPDKCLAHLPRVELPTARRAAFLNGLGTTMPHASPLCTVYADGEFLGIGAYDRRTRLLNPAKVWSAR